jgi:hypothetical protein
MAMELIIIHVNGDSKGFLSPDSQYLGISMIAFSIDPELPKETSVP